MKTIISKTRTNKQLDKVDKSWESVATGKEDVWTLMCLVAEADNFLPAGAWILPGEFFPQ